MDRILRLSIIQHTLSAIHRAEWHLDRLRHDASGHQPLPHLRQSRAGRNLAAVLSMRVLGTAPQDLTSGARSCPQHSIEVGWVRLLRPDVALCPEHEMLEIGWYSGQRVV